MADGVPAGRGIPMSGEVRQALAAAGAVAGRAPSIHNTQPWRLVVGGSTLELYSESSRRLTELDRDGHMMLISCGAAVHHAAVALAADGWRTGIDRSGAGDGLLVRIRVSGRGEPDPVAVRRLAAVERRHSDRRPVPAQPVPAAALAAVVAAVTGTGLQVHVLRPEQVIELAAAVEHAMRAEHTDERQSAELSRWVGGDRADGTGVPDSAIPAQAPQTTVPGRDFGVAGTLPPGAGHDEFAVYAVFYGTGNAPADWLRAGEALSAAWLDAVDRGLTLLPFSAPAEIASSRVLLQRLVSYLGYPYLVVRLGVAPAGDTTARTPRLPADQTVEIRP
jgi:nitroreductase